MSTEEWFDVVSPVLGGAVIGVALVYAFFPSPEDMQKKVAAGALVGALVGAGISAFVYLGWRTHELEVRADQLLGYSLDSMEERRTLRRKVGVVDERYD